MQQLKKPAKKQNCPNRERFEDVCRAIREALHLDHLSQWYEFADDENGDTAAETTVFREGWRLKLCIRPCFWESPGDKQLEFLIHEHVHVVMHVYHQAFHTIQDGWIAPHCRTQVDELQRNAGEIVVDHLTSAIYDLIKDRF